MNTHLAATSRKSPSPTQQSSNSELLDQMKAACETFSLDSSLRAVVLTGATAPSKALSFIGGADISEMAVLHSGDAARAFIMKIHLACKALRDLPVPVIARVNGYALGAGLEIMAACDLRICTSGSVFGMPEVKVGIPSVVESGLAAWLDRYEPNAPVSIPC
jgi:enoyl-CoA hydratase/carnithine racemase